MKNTSLESKITNLINKKSEGEYWDFKEKWHKDNERLLHDILCFANTVHDEDCYLIINHTRIAVLYLLARISLR